jgi:hypothetical protein
MPESERVENPYEPPNSPVDTPPDLRPLWVRVGLWGLRSRAAAWAFVGLSLVLAVAGFVYFWPGVLMVFAAAWYWAAIRWMDRHEAW